MHTYLLVRLLASLAFVVMILEPTFASGVVVTIEGDMVDEADQPFADPLAIVDPYGVGSTCGPNAATQSTGSTACRNMSHYVAKARMYTKGYLKMVARVPPGLDVLVSVCSGPNATFGCRDHPAASFCRPKQSSSGTKAYIWVPPAVPGFVDVRWKFIPEAHAGGYVTCDRKGPYGSIALADEMNVPRLGDNDGSGLVTVTDGVQVLRCAAELAGTSCSLLRSDINCDGSLTVTDGVNVLRIAADLPVKGGCDRDGDGLLDDWEAFGYDGDGDGIAELPLNQPPFNASPFHRDIFVECDYMQDSDHTHQPLPAALDKVVAMFNAAPVSNPDGTSGVRVHLDTGQLGGGNAIPDTMFLQPNPCAALRTLEGQFRNHSRSVFHYCVVAHQDAAPPNTSGGQKCDNDRSEFYISLGEATSAGRVPQNTAAAIAHELGHDLGLNHGGSDGGNFKPNYLSIMNYSFAYGLRFQGVNERLDYSRFSMADLAEGHLFETRGLDATGGDGQLASYGTVWYDPSGTQRATDSVMSNIDWNFNGNPTDQDIQVNIDGQPFIIPLDAWNDWDHLRYNSGTIGAIGTPTMSLGEFDQPIGISCDLPYPP